MHDGAGLKEIIPRQAEAAETESRQSAEQAVNVCIVRTDPDVQITGIARVAMRGERVAADDQLLNSGGVE